MKTPAAVFVDHQNCVRPWWRPAATPPIRPQGFPVSATIEPTWTAGLKLLAQVSTQKLMKNTLARNVLTDLSGRRVRYCPQVHDFSNANEIRRRAGSGRGGQQAPISLRKANLRGTTAKPGLCSSARATFQDR